MKQHNRFTVQLLASAAMIACLPGIAAAQVEPTTSAPADPGEETVSEESAEDGDVLVADKVIITALRRGDATTLMETPLSVSVTSGEELESKGVSSIMDALSSFPGVSTSPVGSQGSGVTVRGVAALVGDSPVAYYLDEIPFSRIGLSVSPDLNPYDLDRVEVLRGPQGTLFGLGSAGGTVRILTKDPVIDEFEGKLTVGTSTTDKGGQSYKYQGAINLPIIENKLALRASGSFIERAGYIDRPLEGQEDFNKDDDTSYRVKLLFTPTDELSLKGSYWHTENRTHVAFADENYDYNQFFFNTDPLTFAPDFTSTIPAEGSKWAFADNETDIYGLVVKYENDALSFTSATSYLENSSEQNYDSFLIAGVDLNYYTKTKSQEFLLASVGGGALSWTTGVSFIDIEMLNTSFLSFFLTGVPDPFSLEFDSSKATSKQQAVFGEATYDFADDWSVTVGGRYFEDKRGRNDLTPSVIAGLNALGLEPNRSRTSDKFTGRLNLSWAPNQASLYYVNVAQGFRAGTNNPGSSIVAAAAEGISVPSVAQPDEILNYELGGKLELLGGDLLLEAAAYFFTWDDVQTYVTFIDTTGTTRSFTDNAAKGEGRGIDLTVSYTGIEGLDLSLAGNLSNNEFKGDAPTAGLFDGDAFFMAPDVTVNASAAYSWPINETLSGTASLSANYLDERTDYSLTSRYTTEASTLVNGRVGVGSESWDLYLTAENLFNEDSAYALLAVLRDVGTPPIRPRPRTVGLELNYRF